ncbi:MAG: M20/M25/M40 family metallo-hydrolase [Anaerolineae bacterium]
MEQDRIWAEVDGLRDEMINVLRELVQRPSENTPPTGNERACQDFIAEYMRGLGLEVDIYTLADMPELFAHPSFLPGRDYSNRPNVTAIMAGTGGGRSLLLTGHVDTVPRGTVEWTKDPFGGEVEDGLLYGLGAEDMKGGLAAFMIAIRALRELGVRLKSDLIFESVVDEEFGGVNGTIAGRLHGPPVDGAIIGEGTDLNIYPAARGCRIAHLFLQGPGSVLTVGEEKSEAGIISEQIAYILSRARDFNLLRRQSLKIPPLYESYADPVPVLLTKIVAGFWGTKEPITIPADARMEIYWQTMPGEEKGKVEQQFLSWLDELVKESPHLFPLPPRVEFFSRWMPGTQIDPEHELVRILSRHVENVLGRPPEVKGAPWPCDMFALHQDFQTPAVAFGPKGGNAHAADEYVKLDEVLLCAKAISSFALEWCGVA